MSADDVAVDTETLREEVRDKYRKVAADPTAQFHFQTGRPLAAKLGYNAAVVDELPPFDEPLRM